MQNQKARSDECLCSAPIFDFDDPELKDTAHFHVAIHTSSNLIHFWGAESHYAPLRFAM